MDNLIASAAFFVLLHRGVSGSSLRGLIVERIGETAYGRLFQLATLASLAWLGFAYGGARSPEAVTPLWSVHPTIQHLQIVIQPLAVLLIVAGFTTPNPGTFGQESVADRPDVVRGMLRVTRHPFLWGVALFATGHLIANPAPRNLVLFGTLLLVALTGTLSIDAKRRQRLGDKWTAFAAQTSNVPFAAILAARQPLRLGEIGFARIGVAAALVLILSLAHPFLFGGSVLP